MSEQVWYKGNIHTHTTESDGDAEPEKVVEWYRNHEYDFLILTDHNHLTILDYGNGQDGSLGPLMIPGEEVTAQMDDGLVPVHINGLGIKHYVEPTNTGDIATTIQASIDGILDAGGIASINHPNFRWAFDHETILKTRGASLVEIFNGIQETNNHGVPGKFSHTQIWDHILSAGMPLFGVAVDDSHNYHDFAPHMHNPGRGWVMVEAEALEQESVIEALASGGFYSSTGIYLDELKASSDEISMKIRQNVNVIFVTQFIGKDGKVYQETVGTEASYRPSGDEGYIRAAIRSSAGTEAWTQPVFLK